MFGLEVTSAEYKLDNHSYIVTAERERKKNLENEFV